MDRHSLEHASDFSIGVRSEQLVRDDEKLVVGGFWFCWWG
jgi:hypothetical protein